MLTTSLTNPALRELAHRVSSGTDITLLWNQRTSALTVSVRGGVDGRHAAHSEE